MSVSGRVVAQFAGRLIVVPIRIESTTNKREHWSARAKRAKEQREAIWWHLKAAGAPKTLPCTVTLTRIAPRSLDSDNAIAGMKSVRDGIADYLEVDDSDSRVHWAYGSQRKGAPNTYALEVYIT